MMQPWWPSGAWSPKLDLLPLSLYASATCGVDGCTAKKEKKSRIWGGRMPHLNLFYFWGSILWVSVHIHRHFELELDQQTLKPGQRCSEFMRPPDGQHQQASLFLCELVYLASPTTISKRANRTQAYIFHLWHASLGLCKTRQQTKAWMTASTSKSAIKLARRQSCNTMSSLILSLGKERKKTKQTKPQNTPPCVKQCRTRLCAMAGRYTTGGTGASIPGHLGKTFSSEILFCVKVFTAAIRPCWQGASG